MSSKFEAHRTIDQSIAPFLARSTELQGRMRQESSSAAWMRAEWGFICRRAWREEYCAFRVGYTDTFRAT